MNNDQVLKDAAVAGIEHKTVGLTDVKLLDARGNIGTFSGYGSVFGNVDSHGDVMQQGAYTESLKEWQAMGKWPKMLLQHGGWGMGAEDLMPIGQWTKMEENSRGLKVEGRLFALNTERGQYLYEGLQSGELDALSVGFIPREVREGTKPNEPRRTFLNVDLKEVSVVLFGANDRARISNVKHMTLDELREVEGALRDAGLSHREAVTAVSVLKKLPSRDVAAPISEPRDEVAPDNAVQAATELANRLWVASMKRR